MIRSGARVVLKELARRPGLNGAHGIAASRRKGDRWAVQLGSVPHPVSIASRHLALAATQATSAHCMIIDPLPFSASAEQVRAAIRPLLQPGLPLASEAAEVMALQRELGWRNVQGSAGAYRQRAAGLPSPPTFAHRLLP